MTSATYDIIDAIFIFAISISVFFVIRKIWHRHQKQRKLRRAEILIDAEDAARGGIHVD